MARLSSVLALLLTALLCATATKEGQTLNKKFIVIKLESLAAANAVRKINVQTPKDKVQLATLASDFIVSLNSALYALNNVIPNIVGSSEHEVLSKFTITLVDTAYDIQQAISGGSEKLNEKLIAALDTLQEAANVNQNVFDNISNYFTYVQLQKQLDAVLFAIYKIKYGATFFLKSNKELVPEIQTTVTQFKEALNDVPYTKDIDEKIREVILHCTVLTARHVYKLENFVEVNLNTNNGIKIIQEVAQSLSKVYVQGINVLSTEQSGNYAATEFIKMYEAVLKLGGDLANIEYSDHSGGSEFIRSAIFDYITVGRIVAEMLRKSFLRV